MNHFLITITRQFGSLGRPIAQLMAESLGIKYYDRDIVEATARQMGTRIRIPVPIFCFVLARIAWKVHCEDAFMLN